MRVRINHRQFTRQSGHIVSTALGLALLAVLGSCLGDLEHPAGTFTMGAPSSEPCRFINEDQHQVTLTHAFEIQATEVTQADFEALMGYNPSFFQSCGSTCPVETVSWHEATAYANALSSKKGLAQCYSCTGSGAGVSCTVASTYAGSNIYKCPGYRLPTEAEWEYAYRAGTTTAYYNGANDPSACRRGDANLDRIGWYYGNSAVTYAGCLDASSWGGPTCAGPHPVGQKAANAWGLYDMAGNVWEWTHDWYQVSLGSSVVTDPSGPGSGSYRVLRGGGWRSFAYFSRAALRRGYTPADRNDYFGFRLLRTL